MAEADVITVGGAEISGPPQRSAGVYFPSLDGYRALAAIAVVYVHVLFDVGLWTGQWYTPFTKPLGAIAVGIFFMLFRPFALANLRDASAPSLKSYYTRRFFRILPGYWLALFFMFYVLGQVVRDHDPGATANYFLLTQIYSGDPNVVLGGLYVAWSLCIEVSFYLLVPLIAFGARWIARRASTVNGRMQAQLVLMVAFWIGATVFRTVKVLYWTSMPIDRTWIPGYFDYFAIGMGFAVFSAWLELGGTMPKAFGWLARWPVIPLFFAAEVYFMAMQLGDPAVFESWSSAQKIFLQTILSVSAGFLMLPGIFGPARKGVWRRFTASRIMTLLGLVSFGIYLWHVMWITEVHKLVLEHKISGKFLPVFSLVMLLTLASSTLSYLLVEAPFMRLGRRVERWLKRSDRPTAPPPPVEPQLMIRATASATK
jgi:peptidoglycan/LPS O-acetylase OafA/YrhL